MKWSIHVTNYIFLLIVVLLLLDFKNAFNFLRRDMMLLAVLELVLSLHQFVHSYYSLPSLLFWHDSILQFTEGVQHGDPFGSLVFCLSIHDLCSQLRSDFNVWYLDDGCLRHIEGCQT